MQRLSNQQFYNAWHRTPLLTRLAILTRSVANSGQPLTAIGRLIALVVVLTSLLPPEQRTAVAQQLHEEADALAGPIDRRALH